MGYFQNIVKILAQYWKLFLITGVGYTLLLSVITVFFGAILGILICLCRMSKSKILSGIATAIGEIIRGTPMLLQLYVGYFLVPKLLPFEVSEFMSVSVAFAINSGCYLSEVFRSGIQAVDRGQTEAARSLGMSQRQCMTRIVLPQAIKNILPALGNEFIALLKETSIVNVIGMKDITKWALNVQGRTYQAFMPFLGIAGVYLVLVIIFTRLVSLMEKKLDTGR